VFMPVLCMSNLPRPQQMTLTDTRSNRADHCYTAKQDHFIKDLAVPSVARLDISKFLSFGLPEGESVQEKTSHHTSLDIYHHTGDRAH
jgi:hypothetical protein